MLRITKMQKAFVMMNVKVGTDLEVVRELKQLDHVIGVYEVYSLYDIVAEIEAETMEEIWDTVTSKIRRIGNILSTHTMVVGK